MSKNNPLPSNPRVPLQAPGGLSTAHIRPEDDGITTGGYSSKEVNGDGPCIRAAVGGSLATLSFGYGRIGTQAGTRTARGGGPRREVQGPSKKSLLNLKRKTAQFDWDAFKESGGRAFSAGLTYGRVWPQDPRECQAHLRAFLKRVQRRFGGCGFWRLGIQDRGAFHYHLMLFLPPSAGLLKDLRRFVALAWHEVCGEVSEGHLHAGTSVQELRTYKTFNRASRYLGKQERFPEGLETGRIWGSWGKASLLPNWETVAVTLEDAYKIRRIFKKLARKKGTGRVRGMTVFVRHRTVVRLLEYLGYRDEGS